MRRFPLSLEDVFCEATDTEIGFIDSGMCDEEEGEDSDNAQISQVVSQQRARDNMDQQQSSVSVSVDESALDAGIVATGSRLRKCAVHPSNFVASLGESFVVRRNSSAVSSRGEGPTCRDRAWTTKLNTLASSYSSASFGNPGALQPAKAKRQYAFAKAAAAIWPHFGELRSVTLGSLAEAERQASGKMFSSTSVDPAWISDESANAIKCPDPLSPFWRNAQAKYFASLGCYFDALQACRTTESRRRELLADLGFHVVEGFLSEGEERALLEYWSPDGSVYSQGADEHLTHRRFFHYGPILPKAQPNTTKSTLGVTPAIFGAMPASILGQDLQQRLRDICRDKGLEGDQLEFNQLYVNHYACKTRSRIDFHHDHHLTMRGIIAGVSCGSACELHLRAQDAGVRRPPARLRLPPRSLYLMTGLSRWHLQHAVPAVEGDRLSLTFRSVDLSCAPRPMWDRPWSALGAREELNAHWPLLRPDGS